MKRRSLKKKKKIIEEKVVPEKLKSEFYATIKGPNYDNIWVKHENFGKELDE